MCSFDHLFFLSTTFIAVAVMFFFPCCRYLSCVSQTMKKLQPFGDVPKKLTEQLRRSFVASRTFAQALLEGKQIVNKISKVKWALSIITTKKKTWIEQFGPLLLTREITKREGIPCMTSSDNINASWKRKKSTFSNQFKGINILCRKKTTTMLF